MTMENIKNNEDLVNNINSAIQNQLRFDTDLITSDGWDFFENHAFDLIVERIMSEVEDDEINNITVDDIQDYLYEIIREYEQLNANIRYY